MFLQNWRAAKLPGLELNLGAIGPFLIPLHPNQANAGGIISMSFRALSGTLPSHVEYIGRRGPLAVKHCVAGPVLGTKQIGEMRRHGPPLHLGQELQHKNEE